jgi:hypothetical protein
MARKAATNLERATTPRGEDFLANPKLKAALESLAVLTRETLPNDADFSFGAIRDGAAMLAATEFEAWQEKDRKRTEAEIRKLQARLDQNR